MRDERCSNLRASRPVRAAAVRRDGQTIRFIRFNHATRFRFPPRAHHQSSSHSDHAQRCCENHCQSGLITYSIGYSSASTASTCNPQHRHRRYDIRERSGRHSSQQALHISHTIVLSRIKNHDEIGQCSVRDCQGPSRLCRLHVRMLHLPAHCHSLCARSITPGYLFGAIQRPGRR